MTCRLPRSYDPMLVCGQPFYGFISPGSEWTEACWHHFMGAKRKGWLVKR